MDVEMRARAKGAALGPRSAPRWHIDAPTLSVLEQVFKMEQFPNVETRKRLGDDLKVAPRQIQVWFQNRRQRERKIRSQAGESLGSLATAGSSGSQPGGSFSRSNSFGAPGLARSNSFGGQPPTLQSMTARGPPPLSSDFSASASSIDTTLVSSHEDISQALMAWGDGPNSAAKGGAHKGDGGKPAIPLAPLPPLPFGARSMTPTDGTGVASAASSETCSLPSPAQPEARALQLQQCGAGGWDLTTAHARHDGAAGLGWDGAANDSRYGWQQAVHSLLPRLMPPIVPGSEALKAAEAQSSSESFATPEVDVAARLATSCQSTLVGKTLQHCGGVVQAITEGQSPYRMLSVSPGWVQLTGYSRDEAIGRPLSMLQGEGTEAEGVAAMMSAVDNKTAVSVRLTNYTRDGESFEHLLSVEPLRDPAGETLCFQATSLVLRKPGEPRAEATAVGDSLPMICTDPVPPLWPLLGRAVNPQPTGARGPQDYMETGPTDVGRQRADFNAALNCGLGSVDHAGGIPHPGQGAAVYHHPAMAALDAANPNGSTESALDADLLQWLESDRNDDTELAQALILDAHDVSHQAGALQVDGVHRTDSNGAPAVERMTTAPPLLL